MNSQIHHLSKSGYPKLIFWSAVSILVLFLLLITSGGIGNNFSFQSHKRIIANAPIQTLSAKWTFLPRWISWFHHLEKLESISNPSQEEILKVSSGQKILLHLSNPKSRNKSYTLQFEITAFDPQKKLAVKFISDSTGRLEKMFSELSWQIEMSPDADPKKTWIDAKVFATTKSFRARAYAKLVPSILLNQVCYPNIIAFAENPYLYHIPQDIHPDIPK